MSLEFELSNDLVDIVVLRLDLSAERLRQAARLLSTDERERADRYDLRVNRDRFIACRGALRELLAERVGGRPEAIAFHYGEQGKQRLAESAEPTLQGAPRPAFEFNVSHSGDLALIAFSISGPIGVDLEWVRDVPQPHPPLHRFCTPEEAATLDATSPGERGALFFRLWTRAEARRKASGAGLSGFWGADRTEEDWHVRSFVPAPGWVAALASRGPVEIKIREPR